MLSRKNKRTQRVSPLIDYLGTETKANLAFDRLQRKWVRNPLEPITQKTISAIAKRFRIHPTEIEARLRKRGIPFEIYNP